MKSLIAMGMMLAWSAAIALIMYWVGFADHLGNWLWSLGAAVMLLIGLVGNVWIFIAVVKEEPWQWFGSDSEINN